MKIQALMVANSRAQTMYMMEYEQKKKMQEEEMKRLKIKVPNEGKGVESGSFK